MFRGLFWIVLVHEGNGIGIRKYQSKVCSRRSQFMQIRGPIGWG